MSLSYRLRTYTSLLALLTLGVWFAACDYSYQKQQDNPVDPGGTISLAVAPDGVILQPGSTQRLVATVSGTADTIVSWKIAAGPGSIDGTGLYTAPGSIAADSVAVTVQATLNADTSISATGHLTIVRASTGGNNGGDTTDNGGNNGGGDTTGSGGNPDEVCFQRDVLPIFQSNCAMSGCHDVASRQHGYVFTSYDGILDGVRPGDPAGSKIVRMITGKGKVDDDGKKEDDDDIMPPPPQKPLSAGQIAIITKWIEQGAKNTSCAPPVGSGCDTTNVTFSASVRPVLQTNCVGCHSGSNPPNGINLETHAGVKAATASGKLAGVINHSPGFPAMPRGGNKLPDCTVRQITAWINKGAPNN